MIENILNAVAVSLSSYGYAIYNDTVPQNMETPCFLLDTVDIQTKRRLKSRIKEIYNVSVTFIGNNQLEVRRIAEELPFKLTDVAFGNDSFCGSNIRIVTEATEHTVSCVVAYSSTAHVEESARPLMSSLSLKEGVKT